MMTYDELFWVIKSHVFDVSYNGPKKGGYMYLQAYPKEMRNRVPIIPLEICIYDDGTICGRAYFRMDHKNKNRGPFSLSCAFCGLQTETYDTVEELAEVWNREVIAKKVLAAL